MDAVSLSGSVSALIVFLSSHLDGLGGLLVCITAWVFIGWIASIGVFLSVALRRLRMIILSFSSGGFLIDTFLV
jgi:hypothetical protein